MFVYSDYVQGKTGALPVTIRAKMGALMKDARRRKADKAAAAAKAATDSTSATNKQWDEQQHFDLSCNVTIWIVTVFLRLILLFVETNINQFKTYIK